MEERYLYEYDYAKPELTDEFLEHYGVLGMHWGIRKQPKYTGSLRQRIRKKKAYKSRVKALKKARKIKAKVTAEKKEAAKTKEEIIRTRDAAAMLKNIDKFTTQEINDFNNREIAIDNLSKNVKNQMLSKMTKGQKFKDFVVKNAKEASIEVGKKIIKTAINMTVEDLALKSGSALLKRALNVQEKKEQSSSDNQSKKQQTQENKQKESKKESKKENKKQEPEKKEEQKQKFNLSSTKDDLNYYLDKGSKQVSKKETIKSSNKSTSSNKSADGRSEGVLNIQKQNLNLDYARSVASPDSNSERQRQYRSQINKNIAEIDRLLEDIKKKKK